MKAGPGLREVAADRPDRDRDIRDGPALHVEQPPVDHLLRPERDLGGGLIVVGVELDPADAIAGRHGDGAEILVSRRGRPGASIRNRPEPSARASPSGIGLNRDMKGARPGVRFRAWTMTAAPGTGFPRGSSTRPTTNIRPGAGVGLASSAFAAVDGGPAGEPFGSSLRAGSAEPAATAARDSNVRAMDRGSRLNMARSTSSPGGQACFQVSRGRETAVSGVRYPICGIGRGSRSSPSPDPGQAMGSCDSAGISGSKVAIDCQ